VPMVAARGRGQAGRGAVFRRIWAAYDDSDEARAGFELAVELARRSGARLTVVHIVPPAEEEESVDLHGAAAAELLGLRASSRWRARIASAAACAAPDLVVEACVSCGHPPTALRELLELGRPDLVVAGTKGIGGPWRGLLGGVSQRLRHRSPCPVMLVRPGHFTRRRDIVLVGVDDLERSVAALDLGARLGRTLCARLHLVHVLTELRSSRMPTDERSLLDWASERLDGHPPAVGAELRGGPTGPSLLAACAAHRPRVAVVGVRPHAALRSLVGCSVTDRLVNGAGCPVAVARRGGRG
jgi:nucleotide-binding universal stress UspA family protein